MDNFEQFRNVLDEVEINYSIDELEDGRPLFRISQKIEGGAFVRFSIIFSADHIKILAMGLASVSDQEKKLRCYELFNDFNARYKYFKFSIDSDGDVMFEGDFVLELRDGDFKPNMLMVYLVTAIKVLDDAYPKLMKVLWS